jgi:GT2 family glycosyltransferase
LSAVADTTILILSVDEADRLRHSLPAAMRQEGAEVWVIDNASNDDTAAIARDHGAECLRLDERLSYCAAINAGIAFTSGEAVLLLNADCVLDSGFLALARPHLEQPGVGSVSGRLMRLTGLDEGQRLNRVDTMGIAMRRSRKNLLAGHDRPPEDWDQPPEVFGADGAAALYRRETLEDCAFDGAVLDEDLVSWTSDVDLAWRARLLGWRCACEPRAVGYHVRTYRPQTRRRMPSRERRLLFRNRYLLLAKNEVGSDLWPDLHHVVAYEAMVFAYALLLEPQLLRGYTDALRLLPKALQKREVMQRRRRARGLAGLRASGFVPSGSGALPLLATRPAGWRAEPRTAHLAEGPAAVAEAPSITGDRREGDRLSSPWRDGASVDAWPPGRSRSIARRSTGRGSARRAHRAPRSLRRSGADP